jgi:hypothetical protein
MARSVSPAPPGSGLYHCRVTSNPSDPAGSRPPAADDTAAFQRFYFEEEKPTSGRSWWYRVLVGWWRGRD